MKISRYWKEAMKISTRNVYLMCLACGKLRKISKESFELISINSGKRNLYKFLDAIIDCDCDKKSTKKKIFTKYFIVLKRQSDFNKKQFKLVPDDVIKRRLLPLIV